VSNFLYRIAHHDVREFFMAKKPKILAFAGSLREHSYSKRIVKTAAKGARNAGAEVTYIDLRDYPMPLYNEDEHEKNGFSENALKFQKLLAEHDGFLIASPEYNGSLSGALKNAIDWASRGSDEYKQIEVFKGKVAAIMSESPGAFGGLRCLGHLRGVLSILLVNVLPSEIAVGKVSAMFDGDSEEMTDEKMRGILENLGASLADMLKKTHGEIEVVAEAGS
jgi:NAD(P)H-dependent FMN reductase